MAGEDSHSHSGSDCSADQEKFSWRGFDGGVGGVASLAAQLALPPPQLEFGQSGVSNGRGVWSKSSIPANTRFGPFLGKWVSGSSGKFYHRNNCFFLGA